jgi:hypothetical protein
MKNEPVAWISEKGNIYDELPPITDELIPLYANPVKELTDEEIWLLIHEKICTEGVTLMDFARAILKKAQE